MELDREALTGEYIKMYNNITSKWLKFTGFARFSIKRNRIEEKTFQSVVYGTFIIFIFNMLVIYIIYAAYIRDQFIYLEEVLVVLQTNFMIHGFLVNITFSNRNTGSDLIHSCIDIDMILGSRETKFMRDIVIKRNSVISFCICNIKLAIFVALYIAFDVEMDVHIAGSTFFILVFSILYDCLFLLTQYSFLSMRVKYLNIALMKTANVKLEYLPDIFLFNGILWKNSFNDNVTFDKNTDLKQYLRAFEMIYEHIRRLGKCYRFTILFTSTAVLLNSLICIHTVFVVKDIELLRKICITMLAVLTWILLMALSMRSDIVLRQVEQTKVICAYAQLKPSNTGKVLKLAKSLLNFLNTRDTRPFVYSIFHFDTGMVIRLAACTFVYMTIILQSRTWGNGEMEFAEPHKINATTANP